MMKALRFSQAYLGQPSVHMLKHFTKELSIVMLQSWLLNVRHGDFDVVNSWLACESVTQALG